MSNATLGGSGGGGSGDVVANGTLTDNALIIGDGSTTVQASNQLLAEGTAQTVGNVTADVITLDLGGSAAGYRLEAMVVGFESTTPAAPDFSIRGGARTTGAASAVIGTPTKEGEGDTLTETDVEFIASGNNLIVRVTGETGLTINWRASMRYISVS